MYQNYLKLNKSLKKKKTNNQKKPKWKREKMGRRGYKWDKGNRAHEEMEGEA